MFFNPPSNLPHVVLSDLRRIIALRPSDGTWKSVDKEISGYTLNHPVVIALAVSMIIGIEDSMGFSWWGLSVLVQSSLEMLYGW